MAEHALLVHKSTGRARLRIPARRNDAGYFASLTKALAECPGVEHIEANPRTASVLLVHTAELDAVLSFAEQRELFARPQPIEPDWVLGAVADKLHALDTQVLERSDGQVGLSSLAFYGLVAATGYQIYRGNIFPAAETLLQHTLKIIEDARKKK